MCSISIQICDICGCEKQIAAIRLQQTTIYKTHRYSTRFFVKISFEFPHPLYSVSIYNTFKTNGIFIASSWFSIVSKAKFCCAGGKSVERKRRQCNAFLLRYATRSFREYNEWLVARFRRPFFYLFYRFAAVFSATKLWLLWSFSYFSVSSSLCHSSAIYFFFWLFQGGIQSNLICFG